MEGAEERTDRERHQMFSVRRLSRREQYPLLMLVKKYLSLVIKAFATPSPILVASARFLGEKAMRE